MKTALKKTHIGASDSVVAYMVKIDWTEAPVVKITANKKFQLTMRRVSDIRGEYTLLDTMQVTMHPGQEMIFVASGLAGYYYLTGAEGCTCKAGRFKQPCSHRTLRHAFLVRQASRKQQEAPIFVMEEEMAYSFEMAGFAIPAGTVYRVVTQHDSQFVFSDRAAGHLVCTCGKPLCPHFAEVTLYQRSAVEAA